jgi:hypothetical protein
MFFSQFSLQTVHFIPDNFNNCFFNSEGKQPEIITGFEDTYFIDSKNNAEL